VSKIKVLIVEDSAVMRKILKEILSQDPEIDVLGTAPDVQVARRKMKDLNPDVVTLDVELPGMDGLTFLEKIMRLRPTPVVMISGYTRANSEAALRALEIGAVDIVSKSSVNLDTSLAEESDEILEKVKAASRAKVGGVGLNATPVTNRPVKTSLAIAQSQFVICIGASAGGVEAMRHVVEALPGDTPPILYAQHMPKEYTRRFAERLDAIGQLTVIEAEDGLRLSNGHLYLAPGDWHLSVDRVNGAFVCRLDQNERVSQHRPSIDVLFRSAARVAGDRAIGVLLTGMGKDGAAGLLEMRDAGCITLGQDEATSMIYGMPRVAAEMGAVQRQVPLRKVAEEILSACSQRSRR